MHYRRHLAILALAIAPLARADVLDDIKPGEWYEAVNSKLSSVTPTPIPPGTTGLGSVMEAWSGGAYDTKRDNLIVWGGGHSNYAGNEIYTFNITTRVWKRVTNPSTDVGGDEPSGVYPDGTPRSRHTYNYILYVPTLDRFCSLGGAGLYPGGQVTASSTFCFDFDKNVWEKKGPALTAGIGSMTVFDPDTKKVWAQACGSGAYFAEWNPATDAWKGHRQFNGWMQYYYTPAIGQGKFLAVGSGSVIQWDLANPTALSQTIATTGATEIVSTSNPGLAYSPKANMFVSWNGGANVYALDLGQKKWIKVPLAATNKVTPTTPQQYGTYGRFQYIPSKDLFIGVNRVSENVFFFRLPVDLKGTTSVKPKGPSTGKLRAKPMLIGAGENIPSFDKADQMKLFMVDSKKLNPGASRAWRTPGRPASPIIAVPYSR